MNAGRSPSEPRGKEERRPSTQRRAELTEAALRIIASRGISALNTRSLAEAVGLSTGAIFKHFPSIDSILDGTVGRVESMLDATYPPSDLPPRERLQRFIEARSETAGSRIGVLRLLLSEQFVLALPEEGVARLRRCVEKTIQFVVECIRQGQKDRTIRDDIDAEVLTAIVLGTVQMLAIARTNSLLQRYFGDNAESVREGLGKLLDPASKAGVEGGGA